MANELKLTGSITLTVDFEGVLSIAGAMEYDADALVAALRETLVGLEFVSVPEAYAQITATSTPLHVFTSQESLAESIRRAREAEAAG